MNRIRHSFLMRQLLIFVFVTIVATGPLYADAVFLKDGSIIEGTDIKETATTISLKTKNNTRASFLRSTVLRILFNDNYKNKVYIYTMDNKSIAAYIVSEDSNVYMYRKNLSDSTELSILKKDVNFVSKTKVPLASGNNSNQPTYDPGYRISGFGLRSSMSIQKYDTRDSIYPVFDLGVLWDNNLAGNRVFNFRVTAGFESGWDYNGNYSIGGTTKLQLGFAPVKRPGGRFWFGPYFSYIYRETDVPDGVWNENIWGHGLTIGLNLHTFKYLSLCFDLNGGYSLNFVNRGSDVSEKTILSYHTSLGVGLVYRFGDFKK